MRLLKNIGNTCLISYSVEKAICNMNLSVLQETVGVLKWTFLKVSAVANYLK